MKLNIHENQSETDLFIQFGGCVDVMFDVRKQSETSISETGIAIEEFFINFFGSTSTTVPDSFFENKIGSIVDSFAKNGVIIDNTGTAETLTGYFSENHSTVARPVKSGTIVFDGQDEIDLIIQTTGSIDSMFSGSSIENFFSSTLVSGSLFAIQSVSPQVINTGTAETLTGYFSENHSTVARPVKSGTIVFDGQDEIDLTIQTTGSIDSMFSGSSIENFFSSTLVSGSVFPVVKTKTNADQQTANKFGLTNFAILNSGTADSLIPKSGVGYWVIESTFVVQ